MDIKTLTLIHKLLTAEQETAEIEYQIANNAWNLAAREYDEIPEDINAAKKAAITRRNNAIHALTQFEDHDWT